MSRIGLLPIPVPKNVEIDLAPGHVSVKGPKGQLSTKIYERLTVETEDSTLKVSRPDNGRINRSQHGLARTLLANMVKGVSEGHAKQLEIHGVGYRATLDGKDLVISAGYSHPVRMSAPEGITFTVAADDKTRITTITVSGIDKSLVGQVAADIRKVRKPDPYKAKGIRYKGEVIKTKQGKRTGK